MVVKAILARMVYSVNYVNLLGRLLLCDAPPMEWTIIIQMDDFKLAIDQNLDQV
jgi:hypothetical protein